MGERPRFPCFHIKTSKRKIQTNIVTRGHQYIPVDFYKEQKRHFLNMALVSSVVRFVPHIRFEDEPQIGFLAHETRVMIARAEVIRVERSELVDFCDGTTAAERRIQLGEHLYGANKYSEILHEATLFQQMECSKTSSINLIIDQMVMGEEASNHEAMAALRSHGKTLKKLPRASVKEVEDEAKKIKCKKHLTVLKEYTDERLSKTDIPASGNISRILEWKEADHKVRCVRRSPFKTFPTGERLFGKEKWYLLQCQAEQWNRLHEVVQEGLDA